MDSYREQDQGETPQNDKTPYQNVTTDDSTGQDLATDVGSGGSETNPDATPSEYAQKDGGPGTDAGYR